MKTASERRREGPQRRFVHLGDRLLAIARIRAGLVSVEEAAGENGVDADTVVEWMRLHAHDRMVSLDEIRLDATPEMLALGRRAELLATLVAEADRELRELHREFLRGLVASNDAQLEARDDSKKVARNHPAGAPRVARLQPKPALARKSVDGDSSR